jgi:hypothetical protein
LGTKVKGQKIELFSKNKAPRPLGRGMNPSFSIKENPDKSEKSFFYPFFGNVTQIHEI